jgi:hypothetical protein
MRKVVHVDSTRRHPGRARYGRDTAMTQCDRFARGPASIESFSNRNFFRTSVVSRDRSFAFTQTVDHIRAQKGGPSRWGCSFAGP